MAALNIVFPCLSDWQFLSTEPLLFPSKFANCRETSSGHGVKAGENELKQLN
jgi:hypothetical protein